MDATISDDPRAPDEDFGSFPVARWRRAGATDQEVTELGTEYLLMDDELQDHALATVAAASDGDLRNVLEGRFGPRAEQAPPTEVDENVTTGGADDHLLEEEALNGVWTPADPLSLGAAEYPLWNLANDWVGTRIGNAAQGFHLVAPSIDALIQQIEHQVAAPDGTGAGLSEGAAAWQRDRHLAALRARATGS